MSLWCFIVCFSLTCCLVSGQDAIYKLVGEKVDFPGFSNKEAPTDILWKHIEGHNVHKVVHFDGSEEKSFGLFQDRVTLDWHSADLSISNLRYEDSGFYDLEILTNNQQKTRRYGLMVIDKVTKPAISCEINNASTSESAGKATLLCSLPSHSDQSSLEFQWSTNGQINLGHVLKISLGGELDDRQYSCTVKNPLTQETAVFTAKDCYPEPKAQAGLIAGVVVLVVVLLLILLLLLFIYLKKVRPNYEKSDLESHSDPEDPKVVKSGSEETRGLLDRTPTCPSTQTLGHLNQRNDSPFDPPHKNVAHMKELRESIRQRPSSENPVCLPVKQPRTFFEKENGKANEVEPREVVEEEVLENNPSDSEAMNPELTALSSESIQKATENTTLEVIKKNGLDDPADSGNPNEVSNDQSLSEKPEGRGFSSPPAVSSHLNHPCSDDERPGYEEKRPDILDKEDNPVDADETKDVLSGSENSEDESNKASQPPAVPQKSNLVRNFSALIKRTENTNPKLIKKKGLDDPADSENPNEVSNDQSLSGKPEGSEFLSPAVSSHLNHPCSDDERPGYEEKRPDILENNPVDPDETKDASPGSENNEDEGNKASHRPAVPQKSNLVRNFSALKKGTENTNPKVKRPASNDSSDSGNPDEVAENQNSGTKKEGNEFEKSTPENDVQPPPVARESGPLSQNSPESSPEAERKQDINSDECAKASNGESSSSSSSSEESEIEEQAPPASTAKDTDSETTVDEQKSFEMETLQK